MAMVKAVRAGKTIKVSQAAFNALYKDKGYRIIGDVKPKQKKKAEYTQDEQPGNRDEDIDTVPISEMSKEQLAEYAKKHDIDTSAARSVSEARKIIKEEVKRRRM